MSLNDFYRNYLPTKNNRKMLKNEVLYNLYKKPKKDVGPNAPKFQPVQKGYVHQADLLFMPMDRGFRYILVVVDIGSRKTDAEPIKNKRNETVLKAFKKIYARKVLSLPKKLEIDDGSEFKGTVSRYFKDNNVNIRVAKPGRHRQQAIVERKNQTIGKALHTAMSGQQLLTGKISRRWTHILPELIKAINNIPRKKQKYIDKPTCEGDSCVLLDIGTKVRVLLDNPIETTGQKLAGRRRSSDIYWDPQIREIVNVVLQPNQPAMYQLNAIKKEHKKLGREPVMYTKNQLQPVQKNEKLPPKWIIPRNVKIKR